MTRPIIRPFELTTAPPLLPGWTAAVVSSMAGNCEVILSDLVSGDLAASITLAITPRQADGRKSGIFSKLSNFEYRNTMIIYLMCF